MFLLAPRLFNQQDLEKQFSRPYSFETELPGDYSNICMQVLERFIHSSAGRRRKTILEEERGGYEVINKVAWPGKLRLPSPDAGVHDS